MVRALRGSLRYRRDQQHVLSPARGGDLCPVGGAGAAAVPLRREGEPLPDAHEEAEGSGRAARTSIQPDATASPPARARALPAAARLEARHPPSGALSAGLAPGLRP